MMNKIFLIGNLSKEPELTETPNGVSVCKFSIAVNRSYASQDGERQTDFFNCTAWRGQAETIAKYCKKGNKVSIIGSIQMRNYEDKQGVKRTAVEVVVQEVEFLTPRQEGAENASGSGKKKPTLQTMEDEEEIPF